MWIPLGTEEYDLRRGGFGRVEGRGLVSGVPLTAPVSILFDLRGGKVSRQHSYLDHGEALRAAGIAE